MPRDGQWTHDEGRMVRVMEAVGIQNRAEVPVQKMHDAISLLMGLTCQFILAVNDLPVTIENIKRLTEAVHEAAVREATGIQCGNPEDN